MSINDEGSLDSSVVEERAGPEIHRVLRISLCGGALVRSYVVRRVMVFRRRRDCYDEFNRANKEVTA